MEKKRNILFVVHQLNFGGVQRALITALQAIDYEKNQVTLYVRHNRTALIGEIPESVHTIVNQDRHQYYRRPLNAILVLLSQLFTLFHLNAAAQSAEKHLNERIRNAKFRTEQRAYFQNAKYDVAISYIQGYNAQFTATCVNADRKYVFFHGSADETHELHEKIFPFFDGIVAVNSAVKDLLASFYPAYADRLLAIENCINAQEIRTKAQSPFPVPDNKLILASCGRLSQEKGFDLAVGAAELLKQQKIAFVWYFIGDGPLRQDLEQAIKSKGLSGNISITGMLNNPLPAINACDIFVQPSRFEAHPLTILEAMVLSKPIVTTKTTGGIYLMQNNTFGVTTDFSAAAIANGIHQLLDAPERTKNYTDNLNKIDYDKKGEQYRLNWAMLFDGRLK